MTSSLLGHYWGTMGPTTFTLVRACFVLLVLVQGAYSADFVGCSLGDFNDMAKQTGHPQNTHVPFAYRKKLEEVGENLSGITYFPSSNTLIGLRHDPPAIFEIDLSGKVLRKIDLEGFVGTEGITHVTGSLFAFTEETEHNIVIVDLGKKAVKKIKHSDAVEIIKVRVQVKADKGLEGLTYDPKADVFYTVKEKDPMQILRVARNGTATPQWQKHKYAQLVHNIATIKCATSNMMLINKHMMENAAAHAKKVAAAKKKHMQQNRAGKVAHKDGNQKGKGGVAHNDGNQKGKDGVAHKDGNQKGKDGVAHKDGNQKGKDGKQKGKDGNRRNGNKPKMEDQARAMKQCIHQTTKEWTITDFSGLSFRPGGGGVVDKLLVLTRDGKAVYAMTTSGHVLERMPVGGAAPEGMVLLPNGRDMFIVSEPATLFRYTCESPSNVARSVADETFHVMLEGYYNQSLGDGESFYRGLVSEEMLERVQEYMGNTTITDFFYDVNATLAFYLPDSLRTEMGVAAADILAFLFGIIVIYLCVVCFVRCVFGGFRRFYRIVAATLGLGRGGKAAASYAGPMEAYTQYEDEELGLELGELDGLVNDEFDDADNKEKAEKGS